MYQKSFNIYRCFQYRCQINSTSWIFGLLQAKIERWPCLIWPTLCIYNEYLFYSQYSLYRLTWSQYNEVKGAYSSSWNSPQNYETPLVNGITQCYLPPDRSYRPAFTPTGQVGTRFIDPVRMKGWVGYVPRRFTRPQTVTCHLCDSDRWYVMISSNQVSRPRCSEQLQK